MSIINQKELKKMFEAKNVKIGSDASKAFSERQIKIIEAEVERVSRNSKIAGRKVVRGEDFNGA